MTVYTYAQLEELWIRAGGPRALAPVAAAIGEAESGGNSDALNPNDNNGTQSSFGIWQISNGTHTPPAPNWANPAVNAQLAVGKWKGAGGFSPWGTFTSGAYRAFLSSGTTPDPNVPGSPTGVSAQVGAAQAVDCLIGNPFGASIGLGPVSVGTSLGPSCLFTKSNARAFIGTGLMFGGGVLIVYGGAFIMGGVFLKAASKISVVVGLPLPGSQGGGHAASPPASAPITGQVTPPPAKPALSSGGGGPKVIQGSVISSSAELPASAGVPAIAAA